MTATLRSGNVRQIGLWLFVSCRSTQVSKEHSLFGHHKSKRDREIHKDTIYTIKLN